MKYAGTLLAACSVATACGTDTGNVDTEATTKPPAPLPDEARALAFQWAALPATDLDSPVIQATRAAAESRWFARDAAAEIYTGAAPLEPQRDGDTTGTVKFRIVDVAESYGAEFLVSVCTNSSKSFTQTPDGQWSPVTGVAQLDVYSVGAPSDTQHDPLRSTPELAQEGTDPSAVRMRYPSWDVFNGYKVSLVEKSRTDPRCAVTSSDPPPAPVPTPPAAGNWFPGWLRPTDN